MAVCGCHDASRAAIGIMLHGTGVRLSSGLGRKKRPQCFTGVLPSARHARSPSIGFREALQPVVRPAVRKTLELLDAGMIGWGAGRCFTRDLAVEVQEASTMIAAERFAFRRIGFGLCEMATWK